LNDELEVASAAAQISAKELIRAAVEREDLTEKQKRSLGEMYAAFGEVLDTWTDMDINTLRQYMQTYTGQTLAWTPQNAKQRV